MTILRDNRELLDKFRQGDVSTLELVYRTYVDLVNIVVQRGIIVASGARVMGPEEHADRMDLIQETFAHAFTQNARLAYDGIREYRPYLLTICRNLLVDWARKKHREVPTDLIEGEPSPEDLQETEIPFADPAVMKVVEEYINSLPKELADVHRQRFELCVSQEQAARNLGLSRQKIRTLEAKLKKNLRRALQKK